MMDFSNPEIADLIRRALREDIGTGDVTTNSCVAAERMATGQFRAKQDFVAAGAELLPMVFAISQEFGCAAVSQLDVLVTSGTVVQMGTVLARVAGPARTLLTCERTALNLMQRMSGVATMGRRFVDCVAGTKTKILDTRKTTPGLRRLEKMAAFAGGVTNHRMGLYDAVLIKNNHITAAGGVTAALAQAGRNRDLLIEIEVRTWAEMEEALSSGAKHLLLDNLTPAEAKQWVDHIAGRASVELSGGMRLDTLRAYAEAGADFISVGAVTHSAIAVDINFRLNLSA